MSATTLQAPTKSGPVQALAILGAGILVLGALFWPECVAAVRVWNESTAYGHCYLILPIAAYLVWDRRDNLRGLTPRPTPSLAWLALPIPFVWLAAERLGIMEFRQFAAIAALEVLCLAVLGWRLFYALSGPLLYLVFLVPFGAFLTPVLQTFTAWFIEAGLTVLGIPHFITDMTIEIAGGTFFVAEACAGLRFLIASIAFGVFFALLNFNSPGRRIAFIAASIIVPILANGVRALGIVVLGQILGSAQAAAADHLVYGWVFFSFVTFLLVVAGLPFREPLQAPPPLAQSPEAARRVPGRVAATAAAFALILTAAGPALSLTMQRNATVPPLAEAPAMVAPEGCRIDPAAGVAVPPGAVAWTMACGTRTFKITLQRLPGSSTGGTLNEARGRLVGPIDADEDATVGPLRGAPVWQATLVHRPPVVAATRAWVNGRPAQGGLAQRLTLARNSLGSATHLPAIMGIVYRPTQPSDPSDLTAAQTDLVRFIEAQPALDADIERITATSSPPPRS